MNNITPDIDFKFSNNYDNAVKKLFEFIQAFNKLSPYEKSEFTRKFLGGVITAEALNKSGFFNNN